MKFSMVDDIRQVLSFDTEDYPKKAAELIVPFFGDIRTAFAVDKSAYTKLTAVGDPFDILQIILIEAMFIDGKLDKKEYAVYQAICDACHYESASGETLGAVMESLEKEAKQATWEDCRLFVFNLREREADPLVYHNFLLALWCLIFANEDLTEREYDFALCFYDCVGDEYPHTFTDCKAALAEKS